MIRSLNLKNLVLVESCEISFDKGLTIISGESGSGKTFFVQAIALALGERADSNLIRQGAERALIEIAFDIEESSLIPKLLEEGGIDFNPEELLIIRREIVRNGKNRAFINSQMVSLPLLQKISKYLIDLVGQQSHADLRCSDYQRGIVDLFGDLSKEASEFSQSFSEEKALRAALEELLFKNAERKKEVERIQYQLQELQDLNLLPDEETILSEEHSRLAHFQTLSDKIHKIHQGLAESPQAVLPLLHRIKGLCDSILPFDPALADADELLKQSIIALQETASFISGYSSRLENDPFRFVYLEERLSQIHAFKKKYGKSSEEISSFRKELEERINEYDTLEQKIEKVRDELHLKEAKTNQLCEKLTQKRILSAKSLHKELTTVLRGLNMPDCELNIEVARQPRFQSGSDLIQFWLTANKGEPSCLVKECISGGELSRLMLAIKRVLAEKNDTLTLIFDEIDANVGGETASLIGDQLRTLGKYRQVFCITHFPQVASFGDQHIRVEKGEKEGRTVALLEILEKKEREKEILRMLGGNNALMKTLTTILFCLFSLPLFSYDYQWVHNNQPWHIKGDIFAVGKAKFRNDFPGHLYYREGVTSLFYSKAINQNNYVSFQAGVNYLNLDWNDNPRFTGKQYNIAIGSIALISTSIKRWRWIVNPGVTVDSKNFDFSNSGVYYGVLWGRYVYSENLGLHIGFYGFWGMDNNYSLPIAGIDYCFREKWVFKVVFPMIASMEYHFKPRWHSFLTWDSFGGPYRFPRRVHGGIDGFKNGIFEVFSQGVETGVSYCIPNSIRAGGGIGWNVGGWIMTKDSDNEHGRYYKFKGAPYATVNLALTF